MFVLHASCVHLCTDRQEELCCAAVLLLFFIVLDTRHSHQQSVVVRVFSLGVIELLANMNVFANLELCDASFVYSGSVWRYV